MRTKPRLIRIKLKLKIHYKFNFSLIDNNFINYNSPKLIGTCHNPIPRRKDVLALAYAWRMHFLLITMPRNAAPKALCTQLAFNRLLMNIIMVLLLFFSCVAKRSDSSQPWLSIQPLKSQELSKNFSCNFTFIVV